jgi:hypothetical protein
METNEDKTEQRLSESDETLARHQAFGRVLSGEQPMRWDNWGRFVHDSRCLTLDGRVVAQWAVNTLRKDLGDDFLERASQRKDAHPIFGSSLWPINDVPWVFANLFSLATQLEMLRFQNKLVRKSMSNNLEAINWAHGLLELEIGGLASRSGWRCAFEPALGNGRKGDVQCKQGSSTLFVEATSMQMSDKERTVLAFHNRLSWQMYLIRSEHEVLLEAVMNLSTTGSPDGA